MAKTASGYCKLQNKNVTIKINVIPAHTSEGAEYAKADIDCEYNNSYHTCKRNDCPIWCDFRP